jgi:branched-subunit amino acid transport protein
VNVWLVLITAGLITFGLRLSFIALFGRLSVPDWLTRALRFVPPAVLSAIIFPEVLLPGGELDLSPLNPRLLAALAASLVAWRTRSLALTIVVGMGILLFLMWAQGVW